MSMTKKSYQLIASTLADYMPMNEQDVDYGVHYANWLDIVNNFVVNLERDNSKFDRQRFLEACGINEQWPGQFNGVSAMAGDNYIEGDK
jgi:hypothetical protein